MLTDKQIKEIQTFLEKSINPLFLYDDDLDGICSYILLKKKYQKGYGVPVKGVPVIDISYLKKVEESFPDLIVILDKAIVDQDFVDGCQLPIIWIDHHPPIIRKNVHYYNSRNNNSEIPTTGLCYQITKQDLWIAMLGCLSDAYIPEFYNEFQKQYQNLLPENPEIRIIYTKTKFGELIKKCSMLIKGKTAEVRSTINILMRVESPYEILENQSPQGKYLAKRAEKFLKEYNELLEEAKKNKTKDKVFLFLYNAKRTSFTSELSNDLIYTYPNKIIIIGRINGENVKLSFRSSEINLADIIERALIGIRGYGGGHDHACGGCIILNDFNRFMDNFTNLISEEISKNKK
jgi:single-stranded DNA-specific DHH superfamily exonuclease